MEITHYGTKGMRWGVRKVRSGGKTFLTGDPSTSVLHPKGRAAAISAGKAAVSKLMGGKAFKSMVFDKDANLITKKGRKGLAKTSSGKKVDKDVARAKKRQTQTKKYLKELNETMKKNWSDADRNREMKNLKAFYKSDLNATPATMKAERKEIIKTLVAAALLIGS